MKPLRKACEGYDEFVAATLFMGGGLCEIRKRLIGSMGSLPRIGGFDHTIWMCMHVVAE